MTAPFTTFLMPMLRRLDPERAHLLALRALRIGLAGQTALSDPACLSVEVLGRRFANPIGLAAGFDKDAVAIAPLMRLGFGFVEAGTVTPRPQSGNPRPRLFRLVEQRAVINRMGMNGRGLEHFVARLSTLTRGSTPLGANVGVNKDAADPERDYPALVAKVAPFSDYIALNVSSPNTPGLRDLQSEEKLRAILTAINEKVPSRPPLLVKVAPDLAEAGLHAVVETCVANRVQGLIISNTTITRPHGLPTPFADEAGGLSGPPLFALSTRVLARAATMAAGRLVLIGCGGVASGRDILIKLRAGASLVQIYTAFAYEGPALIPRLKSELLAALRQDGFSCVADAVGADARMLANA